MNQYNPGVLKRLVTRVYSLDPRLCCVLVLMTLAFYFSMNATNVYIILKDGMAKRAQVIMMGEDVDLTPYFSRNCMDRDALLSQGLNGQTDYQLYYNITGFDHRISLDSFWCWPWDDTAQAVVTERIPAIDGRAKASVRDQEGIAPLEWQTVRYSVLMTRENGQWHVKNLTVQQVLEE